MNQEVHLWIRKFQESLHSYHQHQLDRQDLEGLRRQMNQLGLGRLEDPVDLENL